MRHPSESLPVAIQMDDAYSHQELVEAEDVVAMVNELINGVIDFNNEEIKEILAYVTTF